MLLCDRVHALWGLGERGSDARARSATADRRLTNEGQVDLSSTGPRAARRNETSLLWQRWMVGAASV